MSNKVKSVVIVLKLVIHLLFVEFTLFAETIMHHVYLPKFCITTDFDFSWDDCT